MATEVVDVVQEANGNRGMVPLHGQARHRDSERPWAVRNRPHISHHLVTNFADEEVFHAITPWSSRGSVFDVSKLDDQSIDSFLRCRIPKTTGGFLRDRRGHIPGFRLVRSGDMVRSPRPNTCGFKCSSNRRRSNHSPTKATRPLTGHCDGWHCVGYDPPFLNHCTRCWAYRRASSSGGQCRRPA